MQGSKNETNKPQLKLDEVDLELMALLYREGRAKLTQLGEDLASLKGKSMSHVSVQKRIKKLIDAKIIKIQANANADKLEYISAFVLIDTNDMETKKRIFERFRNCPRLVEMDETTGSYNIIMRAMAPSLRELQCFLNSSWLKRENLNKYEVYFSSNNVKPKFLPLPTVNHKALQSNKAPCGMRCHLCDNYKEEACPGCPATDFRFKTYNDFLPK